MGETEYKAMFGKTRQEAMDEVRQELKAASKARDKQRIRELWDELKRIFVGDDALYSNEVTANLNTAVVMLFLCVILGITVALFKKGFYQLDNPVFLPLMLLCAAQMLVGIVLCLVFRGDRPWLKYVEMILICITISVASATLGYRTVLSLSLPVVLSTRYLSEKLTRWVAFVSAVLMLTSTLGSVTLMVSPDLNVLPVERGTVLTITSNLRTALVSLDIDTESYLRKLLIASFLPNLFQFLVIAFVCHGAARWGNRTVKAQAEASREFSRLDTELRMATNIQAHTLPNIFPAFPDRREFSVYATMDPAKEVGGDFYDFFMVDDRHLAVVVADVSGKGVPAALFMMIGKTLIRDHTRPGKDLGTAFTEVNELLCENNSDQMFITAFEGVLDLVTGEFIYVNAGHEIPFLCRAEEGYVPYKIRPGFVLAGMEGVHYKIGSVTLQPGDRLFQYTDGVTEATDKDNQLFGMDRLTETLNANRTAAPEALLPAVKQAIDAFVGDAPQFDDITMLALEYRERMAWPAEDADGCADPEN